MQRTCPSDNTLANAWPVRFLGVFSAGLPTLLVPWQLAVVGLPEVDLGEAASLLPSVAFAMCAFSGWRLLGIGTSTSKACQRVDRLGGLHVGEE